jgi:hypothetical protein
MQPSSNKTILFLLIFILLLAFASTTMITLQFLGKTSVLPTPAGTGKSANLAFFDNVNGMVNGKVVAVDNNMITIENKRGERQSFNASRGLSITGKPNQTPGAPSSLKDIELGKEAIIGLISNNGVLEVSNISPMINSQVLPIAPSGPPASGSARLSSPPPPLPVTPRSEE